MRPWLIIACMLALVAASGSGWAARGSWDAGQQAKVLAAEQAKTIAAQKAFQEADVQRQEIANQRDRLAAQISGIDNVQVDATCPAFASPGWLRAYNALH